MTVALPGSARSAPAAAEPYGASFVADDASGDRLGFTLAPALQQCVQAPALWWVLAAADADGIECWTWLP